MRNMRKVECRGLYEKGLLSHKKHKDIGPVTEVYFIDLTVSASTDVIPWFGSISGKLFKKQTILRHYRVIKCRQKLRKTILMETEILMCEICEFSGFAWGHFPIPYNNGKKSQPYLLECQRIDFKASKVPRKFKGNSRSVQESRKGEPPGHTRKHIKSLADK